MATEFSCGWVIYGVPAEAVKQGLKDHGIKAFVGPAQRHHTCIFPSRESVGGERPVQGQRPREAEFTEALDGSTVVSVVVTDWQSSQSMTVGVYSMGQCKTALKLPMYATQAARARQAEEDLGHIARALETRNSVPKVDVNQPIKLKLLRLLGLELQEFAFMGFDQLFDERLKPTAAEKWAGYQYVNELGQEEPFPLVANAEGSTAAPKAANTQDILDFRKCRTARQWLDIRKMVEPTHASPAVMEHLRLVLISGLTLEGTPDQLQVVREQAAMLLGRCMAAQKGKDVKDEIATIITKSTGKTLKSLWKVALAGAEAQLKPKVPQVV
jgi:hypothetical protein